MITVNLDEFSFGPNEIHLTVGQPYQLNFTNIGAVKHEATAPVFFQNVAFRKAQDASGEFKAPTLLEVETFAGMVTELWLIPTEAGTYDLICEIEGHFEAGMFATIVVEAAAGGFSPAVVPGSTLTVYGGGTVAQLESDVIAAGASTVAVTVDGAFVVLVAGAPSFVNDEFNAAFPNGLPVGTPMLVIGD